MTRNCYFDLTANTIYVSKSFMKKACTPGTAEYTILLNMQKDRPSATVDYIPTAKKINTYKALTYEAMKEYVSDEFGSDSAQMTALLKTLQTAEKQRLRYATVKQWFLKNFPNYGTLKPLSSSKNDSSEMKEAI